MLERVMIVMSGVVKCSPTMVTAPADHSWIGAPIVRPSESGLSFKKSFQSHPPPDNLGAE